VKSLGAARVIDYKTTSLADIDEKFDVVLDAASMSSFGEVKSILRPGGAYITLLPSLGLFAGMLQGFLSGKRCGFVMVKARSADLNRLADWLAEGKIEASVDATLPLDEVPAALATQEAGKVQGKLAVTVATH